ncbi:MAG: wax ester/triacylglycerol synthase family O-acyltransferase [Desulfosalsimonadaceae bacterium]
MRKNGWLEPMSSVDSFWYSMDESTNRMIITAVMEFDEVVEYARLQDLLEKRLLLYKRFRQRIVWPATRLGLPFWDYDPNFDIRNHIIKLALPAPGDKKTLARMISDLSIVPLDKEKPLWQMHIIENYGAGSVVLLRIHHAIADGIAMVRLLFSLSDLHPSGDDAGCLKKTAVCSNSRNPKKKNKIEMLRSTLNLLFRTGEVSVMKSLNLTEFIQKELMKTLAHPSYITQFSKNVSRIGLTFSAALYQLAFMSEDKRTSLKGRIGTQKSVFWSDPIALDKVRETAKYYRCTANDVVMAAVTGALRDYCLLRGDDLTEAEARFAVPVKVGSKSPNVALGNKFSLVFLHLPLHMDDRVQRIRELRKRIRAAKHSAEAFVGYQAMRVLGLPPKRITKIGAGFFSRKLTGVLASVPGPQVPLYFTDLPIRNVMFWVPRIGNLGLGISIFSYAETVTLGVAVDSRLLPEPEKITGFFAKEFDQMHRGMQKKKQHEETRRKAQGGLRAYG